MKTPVRENALRDDDIRDAPSLFLGVQNLMRYP
jgi:hypothetical protein